MQHQSVEVGVRGICLKRFEQALVKLLPHVEPKYMPLPPPPKSNRYPTIIETTVLPLTTTKEKEKEWPDWEQLPPAARVYGNLPGQLSNRQRATRKEQQIQSMMRCIFALLPENVSENIEQQPLPQDYTIVDFGGGSGHLSIPLALMLPRCRIVVVDLKEKSLDFLHSKAGHCGDRVDNIETDIKSTATTKQENGQLQTTSIQNLWTFSGDIESYTDHFHLGVALHVCGEATDVVLRKCAQKKAAIVAAPCCVGKLNRQKKDPYIYQATTQNTPTIEYPQSRLFQQCLQCCNTQVVGENIVAAGTTVNINTAADDWDALAKAADYSHELDMNNRRNAARRAAKGILEMDRKLFLEQEYPYQATLTRMEPLTATPKHDILVAFFRDDDDETYTPKLSASIIAMMSFDQHADQVVNWTKDHLLSPDVSPDAVSVGNDISSDKQMEKSNPRKRNKIQTSKTDSVDWTLEEEQTIRALLLTQFPPPSRNCSSEEATADVLQNAKKSEDNHAFPTGMGGRKRKLIHFVAEQMGLVHWSVGKKSGDKTVHVGRRSMKPPQAT